MYLLYLSRFPFICLLLLLLRCFLSIRSVVFVYIFHLSFSLSTFKWQILFSFLLSIIFLLLSFTYFYSLCAFYDPLRILCDGTCMFGFSPCGKGAGSPHESSSLWICYFVFNSQLPMYLSDVLTLMKMNYYECSIWFW